MCRSHGIKIGKTNNLILEMLIRDSFRDGNVDMLDIMSQIYSARALGNQVARGGDSDLRVNLPCTTSTASIAG